MKIAIAQMPMHWTPAENTRCILDYLADAKRRSAAVAVFPECATTGYHRRVPELGSRAVVDDGVRAIRTQCAALGIAAVVGSPYYPTDDDGIVWNAAVAIDAGGSIQAVCPKVGLTLGERRFFRAGEARPTFTVGDVGCGVLLCREIRDADRIRPHLDAVRVLFWPGVITWDGERPAHPDDVVSVDIARGCARSLGRYVVQCNWPNSLNDPEMRGMGGSLVISPAGEVLERCTLDRDEISCFELRPDAILDLPQAGDPQSRHGLRAG
jgi:omega-amidase